MDENALLFFQQDIEALPLYERLEGLILDRIADVQIKVQKSQISFYNRHMFACVSFSKVRKAKDCPAHYIGSPLAWITVWNPPELTWLPSPIPTAGPTMYLFQTLMKSTMS